MSTSSNTIKNVFNDIRTALANKWSMPEGGIDTYADAITHIPSSSGIVREVINGVYSIPQVNAFSWSLPYNTYNFAYGHRLESVYRNSGALTSIDISSLINAPMSCFSYAFANCSNLAGSINLPNLISAEPSSFAYAFNNCPKITSVNFSNLVKANYGSFTNAFSGCTNLTSITFNSLTTMNTGYSAFYYTFSGCTSLTSLSFPALTTSSFGSYTNQFSCMLNGVNGCTVHFPSSIQSTIGSWANVTSGFGGTNTTVLFDL